MRSEAELRERLHEAVQARRELTEESLKAEQEEGEAGVGELAEDIANLSGVITTLEWVLGTGAAPEYE